MKINYRLFARVLSVMAVAFLMNACISSAPVMPDEYATKLIGSWEGSVGEIRESIKLKEDSTFVCHVEPRGFLANTLSQPLAATIDGRWQLNGSVIMLTITKEKNENLGNTSTSSIILRMKTDSLILQSDSGIVSVFHRMLHI